MENKKRTLTIIGIFTFILAIIGGTLAYWTWTTETEQQTNVVFTVTSDFSCAADGGGDITSSDVMLAPTTCTDTSRAIKRKVTVTPTVNRNDLTINMDLWLDVNSIGSGLSVSENFKYVLTTSDSSCTEGTIMSSGTFNGKTAGDTVNLLSRREFTSTGVVPETYWLYIWLDAVETSSDTMNQSFNLSLNGSCTDMPQNGYTEAILNGADPDLDETGMIPVTISDSGAVTTADTTTEWYSYEDKEWANAILVTDESRDTYLGKSNIPVDTDDILAYYVWIPRYSYAFPNANSSPETISIKFESADTEKSTGTATGTSYYTHPAFTFDGKQLNGIWVGKFESTPDKSSTCYSTPSAENCNNTTQNPTVLPNTSPLRYQYIGRQFTTSQNISKNGNVYGLTYTSTDAHMMKNSEWGAVAYLSHSEYGVNGEIRINNYYDSTNDVYFQTGCGAATDNAEDSITCEIAYGSGVSEYPQSTTGNITGVFDMSGGAEEYVMVYTGEDAYYWDYEELTTLPNAKYYNLYEFSYDDLDGSLICALEVCGGHALNETEGWYSDYFDLFAAPWFMRGGLAYYGSSAGVFSVRRGFADDGYGSWRSVLAVNID